MQVWSLTKAIETVAAAEKKDFSAEISWLDIYIAEKQARQK